VQILLLAKDPAAALQRDILRHRLTGRSEKQIAAEIGRTPA
jgi:hypothetical protein